MTIGSTQRSPQPASSAASFDVVRRGYDRDQVDAQLRELRDRLAAAEAARAGAEQHARATEDELRTARSRIGTEAPPSSESFGFRAEKILRLAEHEASDVRNRAAKEATALVERARADAERHRHDVEQELISRSAGLDQEAAQRTVTLSEREQQATATLASAREEAARITDDAAKAAEKLLADARHDAEQLGRRGEQDARRRREAADHELRRIGMMNEAVRTEMARLHEVLGAELRRPAGRRPDAAQDPAAPGDGAGAGRHEERGADARHATTA